MNWTQVDIYTSTKGIDPLCGRLLNIGVTGFQISDSADFQEFLDKKTGNWDILEDDLLSLKDKETTVTIYLPENSQGQEMIILMKNELDELKRIDEKNEFGRLCYSFCGIKEEDWANNWKQYFKPFQIGEKLIIKPSWEEIDEKNDKTILEIDPESSFGTGQHNTTKLCLELLQKHIKNNDKILDIGCGSGILSIAGMLLGGENAVAVDIEENAVTTSLKNAEKNGISLTNYNAYRGDIISDNALREKIGGSYNIITANIVADVLIAMSPIFSDFLIDNGILLMSGIISSRKDDVINEITKYGFSLVEIKESEDWVVLSLVFHR